MNFAPSSSEWAQYSKELLDFSSGVANQPIIWNRLINKLNRYGEDSGQSFQAITLMGLVSYNSFRVWPTSIVREDGTLDKEYCYILLNNQILQTAGYLNSNGVFDMDPVEDRFIISGVKYAPSGDTPVAQDNNSPLFTIVILKRDITPTHEFPR